MSFAAQYGLFLWKLTESCGALTATITCAHDGCTRTEAALVQYSQQVHKKVALSTQNNNTGSCTEYSQLVHRRLHRVLASTKGIALSTLSEYSGSTHSRSWDWRRRRCCGSVAPGYSPCRRSTSVRRPSLQRTRRRA